MNKHILLVMKWLKDKDSVSQDELRENSRENRGAVGGAADAAYYDNYIAAAYWVKEYFEETDEDRAQYEKELNK